MHIIFQHFGQNKLKMIAFGTVAIVVIALVIGLCNGHVEPPFSLLDVLGNLRQIGDLQWCSVLFDDVHKWDVIE